MRPLPCEWLALLDRARDELLRPSRDEITTPSELETMLDDLGIEERAIRIVRRRLRLGPDVDFGEGRFGARIGGDW